MTTFTFSQDVETLFETLIDPDFIVARGKALGETKITAETYENDDNEIIVESSRTVRRELPSFLAKLFTPEQTLHFKEVWEEVGDSWQGSYTVTVEGQPVEITAKFSLSPTDSGSEYSISFTAKAKIPLVGKKVEKFILSQTEDGLKAEIDFLQDYLKK